MTNTAVIAAAIQRPKGRGTEAAGVQVELLTDWAQAAGRWDWSQGASGGATFQDPCWLRAWYGALTGSNVTPLIALVSNAVTGERLALLPLIRRRHRGIRIVEFADRDLTDNNAPLMTTAAHDPAATGTAMWHALRKALRRADGGADLLRLRKMPFEMDGAANPLAYVSAARPCSLNGNLVVTGDDFEAHRFARGRNERSQLKRKWRAFMQEPAAAFEVVTRRDQALRVLATIARQQETRMRELGQRYVLNDDTNAAFYRNLVSDGFDRGYVVLTTLSAGGEIVAATLGLRRGRRWTLIRNSMGEARWLKYSPGILLIDQTMAALHQDGVREFDFSIGNYAYKRRLGATAVPLANLSAALSWRGAPFAL
ncbi:MAG: GNAT family N-acetyltransferase, partial [Xanthobacteraceae bacterium]